MLSSNLELTGTDPSGPAKSCYGTKTEQKNTQNNTVEGEIRRYITVDKNQQ